MLLRHLVISAVLYILVILWSIWALYVASLASTTHDFDVLCTLVVGIPVAFVAGIAVDRLSLPLKDITVEAAVEGLSRPLNKPEVKLLSRPCADVHQAHSSLHSLEQPLHASVAVRSQSDPLLFVVLERVGDPPVDMQFDVASQRSGVTALLCRHRVYQLRREFFPTSIKEPPKQLHALNQSTIVGPHQHRGVTSARTAVLV